jgi:hypothetical protein
MAKKSNLVTIVLSVVLVLGLVYFFRPQTFSFLTQGFNPDMGDLDPDGFDPDLEPEGFFNCKDGEELVDGTCVPIEGFFACVDGVDEDGKPCSE